MRTAITDLLDISVPIIQAPMAGGGDTVELVAAVSNAGALGCIGAAYLTPAQIIERAAAIRAATSRPFGINLFAPSPSPNVTPEMAERAIRAVAPYYAELGIATPALPEAPGIPFDDQVAACLESGASVFSFTFGLLPATTVAAIKAKKVLLVGTATTVEEARALSDVGVDAVIAQGTEAGGHRGTFSVEFPKGMIGVIALVPQICDAVSLPVVASGGIMDGRGIAGAIALARPPFS